MYILFVIIRTVPSEQGIVWVKICCCFKQILVSDQPYNSSNLVENLHVTDNFVCKTPRFIYCRNCWLFPTKTLKWLIKNQKKLKQSSFSITRSESEYCLKIRAIKMFSFVFLYYREFLTGFTKRKLQRKKKGAEQTARLLKAEQKRIKEEVSSKFKF